MRTNLGGVQVETLPSLRRIAGSHSVSMATAPQPPVAPELSPAGPTPTQARSITVRLQTPKHALSPLHVGPGPAPSHSGQRTPSTPGTPSRAQRVLKFLKDAPYLGPCPPQCKAPSPVAAQFIPFALAYADWGLVVQPKAPATRVGYGTEPA